VGSRLLEEESRCLHYLSTATHPRVREIVCAKLITPSLIGILHMETTGLDAMINENRSEDMSRLYKVFSLVAEGLPALKKELKMALEIRGNAINQLSDETDQQQVDVDTRQNPQAKTTNALKWVQGVLDLRDRFMSILRESFDSDPLVEESIGEVRRSW
jgi:cullin 3